MSLSEAVKRPKLVSTNKPPRTPMMTPTSVAIFGGGTLKIPRCATNPLSADTDVTKSTQNVPQVASRSVINAIRQRSGEHIASTANNTVVFPEGTKERAAAIAGVIAQLRRCRAQGRKTETKPPPPFELFSARERRMELILQPRVPVSQPLASRELEEAYFKGDEFASPGTRCINRGISCEANALRIAEAGSSGQVLRPLIFRRFNPPIGKLRHERRCVFCIRRDVMLSVMISRFEDLPFDPSCIPYRNAAMDYNSDSFFQFTEAQQRSGANFFFVQHHADCYEVSEGSGIRHVNWV